MTQEDKKLLLKDLCARLPYGVKVSLKDENGYNDGTLDAVFPFENGRVIMDYLSKPIPCGCIKTRSGSFHIEENEIKPFLFPLSSMTEEQKTSHNFLKHSVYTNPIKLIDWYNKNHFDYHGLIEKGIALDATGLNIY